MTVTTKRAYFRTLRSDLRKWAKDKPAHVREIASLLGHTVLQIGRDPLNAGLARQAGRMFLGLVVVHGEYFTDRVEAVRR